MSRLIDPCNVDLQEVTSAQPSAHSISRRRRRARPEMAPIQVAISPCLRKTYLDAGLGLLSIVPGGPEVPP